MRRLEAAYPVTMSHGTDRLEQAFAALNSGDTSAFQELFAEHGQWLAIPGSGPDARQMKHR